MTIEENVYSSNVQFYDLPSEEEIINWLKNNKSKLLEEDIKMHIFIIYDIKKDKTYEYQIMSGKSSNYIKKIIHNGILLKEKDIMPRVEKRLCDNIYVETKIEKIIKKLSSEYKTIATMESCTGGSLAGCITNVSGASDILQESYVTYCNEAKIKLGVPVEIIEKYTVYSLETSEAMATAVKEFARSNIGIGITGQLGRIDPKNTGIEPNKVWYTIDDGDNTFSCEIIIVDSEATRQQKKMIIINEIIEDLYNLY